MRALVLASSSRYRAELLGRLGLPFETRAPEIDESPLPGEDAGERVVRLACEKAAAVASHFPDALIVGSDQLAVCGTDVLGKPGTEARARAQLATLSGKTVTFLTGLCLLDAVSAETRSALVTTPVHFRHLRAGEIADYVTREMPLDCAGAFKSEGLGIALFDAIGGEDPSALIGLPLIALCRMLGDAGLAVLDSSLTG